MNNLRRLLSNYRLIVAFAIMALSSLALLYAADGEMHDDIRVYSAVSHNLLAGKMPYRDNVLEYPPYAIPIFALPHLLLAPSASDDTYRIGFAAAVLLGDWIVKLVLMLMFWRRANVWEALLPLAFYSLAISCNGFYFLQRYDVWPALICVLAVWLCSSDRFVLGGLAVTIAVCVKAYPAVLAPPLFFIALRQNRGWRLILGAALGAVPLGLLSFVAPWWHFIQFQTARGLQAESIYSSLFWLGRHLGLTDVTTTQVFSSGAAGGWREVQGRIVSAFLPWIRIFFMAVMGLSTLAACWAASKSERLSASQIARILLIPLLAFIAFNQILSPQYLIWIVPLAAIAVVEAPRWSLFLVLVAAIITPIVFFPFFPADEMGFDPLQTVILAVRNLILVAVWFALVREMFLAPGPTAVRGAVTFSLPEKYAPSNRSGIFIGGISILLGLVACLPGLSLQQPDAGTRLLAGIFTINVALLALCIAPPDYSRNSPYLGGMLVLCGALLAVVCTRLHYPVLVAAMAAFPVLFNLLYGRLASANRNFGTLRLTAVIGLILGLQGIGGFEEAQDRVRVREESLVHEKNAALLRIEKGHTMPADFSGRTINIDGYINTSLGDSFFREAFADDSYAALPAGRQVLGGIPFDIHGIVLFSSDGASSGRIKYPSQVEIGVGNVCHKLHLLGGVHGFANIASQQVIAKLLINYVDGTKWETELKYGVNIANKFGPVDESLGNSDAQVVWVGSDKLTESLSDLYPWFRLRAIKTTIVNPHADLEIATLIYQSIVPDAAPYLISLTVE